MIGKARTTKVLFRELMPLDHGPHRSIEDKDTLSKQVAQGSMDVTVLLHQDCKTMARIVTELPSMT